MGDNVILCPYKKGQIPNIDLNVVRVESSMWALFAKHHYLTNDMNKSCKCLLFLWNNEPIGFVGLLNSPRKGYPNGYSISRIVILPQFQGLGLSMKILNFCGGILKSKGEDYFLYIKTIHEKMGGALERSPNWQPTSYNGKLRKNVKVEGGKYNNRLERKSFCYKYVGEAIDGYDELLTPIDGLRKKKKKENKQLTLFNN